MYILIINRIIELRTIIIKKANQMDIDLKLSKKEIIEFFMFQWLSEQLKDKIQMVSWFEIYSNKSYEIEFYCLLMNMKFFLRKFVSGCHSPHILKRLNLLLEPRRHLQRLGFVYFRPGAGRSWSQCLMSSRQVSGLRSHVRAPVPTPPAAPRARGAQCRALAPRPSPLPPPKTFLSIAKESGQGRRTIGKHR